MSGNPTKNCTIITNIILSEVTSSERTIDSSKFTFNASWSYKNGSYPVDYFSLVFGNGYKCNTTNNWYNGPIIWDGGLSNYMTLSIRPIDSEGHIGKSSGIAIYSPSAYINYYQFGNGQVKFEAISSYDFDGEIIQYFWDFGDGETSIEKETLHNYSNPGYYNVSLTVTDNDGFKSTENITISVLIPPEPPVAKISGPYTINKGEFVILNASGSYDPDLDGRIISYKWDFGDGETGYGQIVNHTYNTTGTYDVTVTVMDEYGLTDTETTSVTVIDSPKEASKDNGGSPGFELIFIIIALGVILYFKRRKIS